MVLNRICLIPSSRVQWPRFQTRAIAFPPSNRKIRICWISTFTHYSARRSAVFCESLTVGPAKSLRVHDIRRRELSGSAVAVNPEISLQIYSSQPGSFSTPLLSLSRSISHGIIVSKRHFY